MNIRTIALILIAILPAGKIFLYRLLFKAQIGRRVRIGFGAVLLFEEIDIGDDVNISPFCLVRVQNATLGLRVTIGKFTNISVNTLELGPSVTIASHVSIKADICDPRCLFSAGAETWVFDFCFIDVSRPVRLGRNVGVGGGTYIFTHGRWLSKLDGYPLTFGEVTAGNNVWISWCSFIYPGVDIGEGVVIGARSVVSKSIPSFAFAAGFPANVLREKANIDVPTEKKIHILIGATKEYCHQKGLSLTTTKGDEWIHLNFDNIPTIAIAKHPSADYSDISLKPLLKVIQEPLKSAPSIEGAAYSISSSQCTSRNTFSASQADWLQHLRLIGTRHYPVDEVSVED